jgi:hypothetical protein
MSTLIQTTKIRWPLAQATADIPHNVLTLALPLSEGRAAEAWEPSNKMMPFPPPDCKVSLTFPIIFHFICSSAILSTSLPNIWSYGPSRGRVWLLHRSFCWHYWILHDIPFRTWHSDTKICLSSDLRDQLTGKFSDDMLSQVQPLSSTALASQHFWSHTSVAKSCS